MMPMDLTSTPFLSYREIKTDDIDLFDDAWGFYSGFHDVIDLLNYLNPVAGKRLILRLKRKIRKNS